MQPAHANVGKYEIQNTTMYSTKIVLNVFFFLRMVEYLTLKG